MDNAIRGFERLKRHTVSIGSVTKRQRLLRRLREVIMQYEDEILYAIACDVRKSTYEAYLTEVHPVYSEIGSFIRHLRRWTDDVKAGFSLAHLGSTAYVRREPHGVVLIYAPWNYPFHLLLMPLIAAIAGGNRVMLSPSPSAPHTAKIVSVIISKVFEVDQVCCLTPETFDSDVLLRLPFDYIFYTGNPAYGKVVAREAGERCIPITLELGGKSPCVVMADADLRMAARRIAWAKLLNAGQTCVAPDYLLVDREIYTVFVKYLIEALRVQLEWITNDPNARMLPLIRPEKALELKQWIEEAGEVISGGRVDVERGMIEPTLLLDPADDTAIMQYEIFAPVIPIIPIDGVSEAIAYLEDRSTPLAFYFYGCQKDFHHILRYTRSGSAALNDCIIQISHHGLPFGGVGASGYGRYHGRAGLKTFTVERGVLEASRYVDPSMRYQLGRQVESLRRGPLRILIKLLQRF